MDSAQDNPAANTFSSGVTEAKVEKAIQASGYPLQLVVSQALSSNFSLQEEWSFVDSISGLTRTIDIVASKGLYEHIESGPRVRPGLDLVIECKQSDLPYIFFLSESRPWVKNFPIIAGLKDRKIVISSDDDPSTWSYDPLHLLGLNEHSFLKETVPYCMTFSKCVRKGSDFALSGSDSYQNLIFPIIEATNYFDEVQRPTPTAYYFDCRMVVGVAVLDAPMVGVHLTDTGTKIEMLPWVRVVRHQPLDGNDKFDRSQVFGIDMIHKDYLLTYIDQHVLPFANEFSSLILKHPDVMAEARGFVPGMGQESWMDIEPRLRPVSISSKKDRVKAGFRSILSLMRLKGKQ